MHILQQFKTRDMKAEIDIALMQYLQDKRTHEEVITYLIGEFEKQSNQKVIEELELRYSTLKIIRETFGSIDIDGMLEEMNIRIQELKGYAPDKS